MQTGDAVIGLVDHEGPSYAVAVNKQSPDTTFDPAEFAAVIRDPQNGQAWDEFVALYGPLLYCFGVKHGLQDADAETWCQDVLVSVSRAIAAFEACQGRSKTEKCPDAAFRFPASQEVTGEACVSKPYDATIKDLAAQGPADFVTCFDGPTNAVRETAQRGPIHGHDGCGRGFRDRRSPDRDSSPGRSGRSVGHEAPGRAGVQRLAAPYLPGTGA